MRSTLALALLTSCLTATISAQSPSSSFPRGNSQQAWQNPGLPAVLAKCKVKPPAFAIKPSVGEKEANAEPVLPPLPTSTPIPGVIAAGQTSKVVWSWQGNNADGPIAGDKGNSRSSVAARAATARRSISRDAYM